MVKIKYAPADTELFNFWMVDEFGNAILMKAYEIDDMTVMICGKDRSEIGSHKLKRSLKEQREEKGGKNG